MTPRESASFFASPRHQRGDIAVFAIDSAHAVKLPAGCTPDACRRPLLDSLQVLRRVEDRRPVLVDDGQHPEFLARQMLSETGADDAAWMEGEGTHAFGLATLVQREREKDVGRLRLAIGRPAVIVAAFEIGVLEHDGRTAVSP